MHNKQGETEVQLQILIHKFGTAINIRYVASHLHVGFLAQIMKITMDPLLEINEKSLIQSSTLTLFNILSTTTMRGTTMPIHQFQRLTFLSF